jgi:hypothetical protein
MRQLDLTESKMATTKSRPKTYGGSYNGREQLARQREDGRQKMFQALVVQQKQDSAKRRKQGEQALTAKDLICEQKHQQLLRAALEKQSNVHQRELLRLKEMLIVLHRKRDHNSRKMAAIVTQSSETEAAFQEQIAIKDREASAVVSQALLRLAEAERCLVEEAGAYAETMQGLDKAHRMELANEREKYQLEIKQFLSTEDQNRKTEIDQAVDEVRKKCAQDHEQAIHMVERQHSEALEDNVTQALEAQAKAHNATIQAAVAAALDSQARKHKAAAELQEQQLRAQLKDTTDKRAAIAEQQHVAALAVAVEKALAAQARAHEEELGLRALAEKSSEAQAQQARQQARQQREVDAATAKEAVRVALELQDQQHKAELEVELEAAGQRHEAASAAAFAAASAASAAAVGEALESQEARLAARQEAALGDAARAEEERAERQEHAHEAAVTAVVQAAVEAAVSAREQEHAAALSAALRTQEGRHLEAVQTVVQVHHRWVSVAHTGLVCV